MKDEKTNSRRPLILEIVQPPGHTIASNLAARLTRKPRTSVPGSVTLHPTASRPMGVTEAATRKGAGVNVERAAQRDAGPDL